MSFWIRKIFSFALGSFCTIPHYPSSYNTVDTPLWKNLNIPGVVLGGARVSSQLGNLTLVVLKRILNYKFRKKKIIFGLPELPGKPLRIRFNIPGGCSWGDFAQNLVMAIRSDGKPTGARAGYFSWKIMFTRNIPGLEFYLPLIEWSSNYHWIEALVLILFGLMLKSYASVYFI